MKRKKYSWQRIKDKQERAKARAKFYAKLITFNRPDHPSTKFKVITDYGKVQSQFLTEQQKLEKKLKKLKERNLE